MIEIVPCDNVPGMPYLHHWYSADLYYPPFIEDPQVIARWCKQKDVPMNEENIHKWYVPPQPWNPPTSSLYWCPKAGPMLFRHTTDCRNCFPHKSHPALECNHAWDVKADKDYHTGICQAAGMSFANAHV